jgi:hypothetical protein
MAIHPPPKADPFEEGVFSPSMINNFIIFVHYTDEEGIKLKSKT